MCLDRKTLATPAMTFLKVPSHIGIHGEHLVALWMGTFERFQPGVHPLVRCQAGWTRETFAAHGTNVAAGLLGAWATRTTCGRGGCSGVSRQRGGVGALASASLMTLTDGWLSGYKTVRRGAEDQLSIAWAGSGIPRLT